VCGIVGYVGHRLSSEVLLDALKRLEYRGYDSCGLAVLNNGTPHVARAAGPIAALDAKVAADGNGFMVASPLQCGIGHTRWATHGGPTETNAHPHSDCSGNILVAHNGIIENYRELKERLTRGGHVFRTETDTEVVPHLIEHYFSGSLEEAVRAALADIEGAFGVVVVSSHDPGKIVVARDGAPLVLGLGSHENFVASDAPALLPYTRDILYLEDSELCILQPDSIRLTDFSGNVVERSPQTISWSAEVAEKGGYPHFMLKEIYEQPRAIQDSLSGRIRKDGSVDLADELAGIATALEGAQRLEIVACGTSLHAGILAKFMIERLASIPVDVDIASEYRYRSRPHSPGTVVVGISQSGETADTLAGLKQAGAQGLPLLGICNVVGSSMTRLCDSVLHTHAGPEIGVASTKAFTTQLSIAYLLALYLAQQRGTLSQAEIAGRTHELAELALKVESILDNSASVEALAQLFAGRSSFLFLGRGANHPIALEGALKLKEISYVHAEGFPAGEMKHGPIALISDTVPIFFVIPRDEVHSKSMANLEEVKCRGGIVVAVATEGDVEVLGKADHTLIMPTSDPLLYPVLANVYLQLFAYHFANSLGRNVDRPRNLAKSVTVE
jgi:glucosamine--fructose-6-phosphate aminotransferase (isomerizing)